MSTCSYVYVFIRNKNRFIPLYNGESLIAFDIKLSIINILGETFLVSILRIALPRYSLIYYDFKDYGIPYIFLSIIFHVIFDETLT
jgi:lathosterol oxidase